MAMSRKQPPKPKAKRPRPVHEGLARLKSSELLTFSELTRLVQSLPPALRKVYKTNKFFSPRHHLKNMALTKKFLASLGPETKVLEMGAGSGRLTNFLLKNSSLRPENYTMFDLAYDKAPPWFKRKVSAFINAGRLKLIKGDMFTYSYPRNAFHHVLIPEAFFVSDAYYERVKELGAETRKRIAAGKARKGEGKRKYREASSVVYVEELKKLVDRLAPAVKKGGSIRLSKEDLNFHAPRTDYIQRNAAKLFPQFKVTVVRGKKGLVFEKR